jgi:hypothetical protein
VPVVGHGGREIAGHQRAALRVVPQLPKTRLGSGAGRPTTRPSAQAGLSLDFLAGLPSTNYPYTTQMGFPGSALGSEIQEALIKWA